MKACNFRVPVQSFLKLKKSLHKAYNKWKSKNTTPAKKKLLLSKKIEAKGKLR